MEQKVLAPTKSTKPIMANVQKEFETWRKTRKKRSPVPKELWEAAIELTSDYTIYEISKALGINSLRLEKKILSARGDGDRDIIKRSTPSFIELNLGNNISTAECIVEVENKAGSKIKMYFKGKPHLDLMKFGKAFLEQTS
jgi:hypothetical protein